MLLYKLHFIAPMQATRRALSARILAGALPEAVIPRARHRRLPDASGATARRARKLL